MPIARNKQGRGCQYAVYLLYIAHTQPPQVEPVHNMERGTYHPCVEGFQPVTQMAFTSNGVDTSLFWIRDVLYTQHL